MRSKRKRIGVLLLTVGVGSVLTSLGLWLYNRAEENHAAEFTAEAAHSLVERIEVINSGQDTTTNGNAGQGNGSSASLGVEDEPASLPDGVLVDRAEGFRYTVVAGTGYIGVLRLPSLGLTLPVNSQWSYPALRNTPCRFSGSIEGNDLVIAAHRYDSHFAGIHTLTMGEIVTITSVDGVEHHYQLVRIETVQPSATREVVYSDFDLTLFTCTYSGQARTIVRFMRLADEFTVEEEE